jgi:ribosome-binding factor A
MKKIKTERMNTFILRELSLILRNEVKDPLVKNCTITAVEVTNDLSYAKVYVTFMNHSKRGLEALQRSKGFIRSTLARRLTVRKCPELIFVLDTSLDYGNKIESILDEINKK